MRPRPFKFFFGATIAVMAFFFLAKVFFIAFVVAAVMSLLFHLVRGIKYSLMDMERPRRRYDFEPAYERFEDFDSFRSERPFDNRRRERIIEVL